MPRTDFKGNVRPPMEIPAHVLDSRKNVKEVPKVEVPLLIKLFTWLCVIRSVAYLTFGLIVGLSPESGTAALLVEHFDRWSRRASPEAVFYILALMYGLVAFRWLRRDWKARWVTMFLAGANAATVLVNLAANHAAGDPIPMATATEGALIAGALFNLLACAYLAFWPGMDQAFKETPWD
jgi:hypothetical protein